MLIDPCLEFLLRLKLYQLDVRDYRHRIHRLPDRVPLTSYPNQRRCRERQASQSDDVYRRLPDQEKYDFATYDPIKHNGKGDDPFRPLYFK